MTRHLELLLDDDSERQVRAEWDALDQAGLPSLAQHRSASNRPHVTVTFAEQLDADGVTALTRQLPLAVRVGALTCFGAGPFVLVHGVVVTTELLALHAAASAFVGEPATPHVLPGQWIPHISLAHRLDAEQLAHAVALLAGSPSPVDVRLDRLRIWDSITRTERQL